MGSPGQLENADTDEVYWELQKFLVLALKANPNILEVLYSTEVVHVTPLAQELLDMRSCFVSKMVFQTYNGYVMSQFKKLTQRLARGLEPKWKHGDASNPAAALRDRGAPRRGGSGAGSPTTIATNS